MNGYSYWLSSHSLLGVIMNPLRSSIHWCVFFALLCFAQITSSAEKRVALVIGNSNYENSPLQNPVNDAQDMSIVLRKLGFDVIELTDASRRDMFNGIREFRQKLRGTHALGLFYFAGHGAQYEGRNYLLPIDHQIRDASELQVDSISAQDILVQMKAAGNPINVVILDACRNQPFPGSSRDGARGLARMDSISGSLIAYATAPGSIAEDGNGRNGVYTSALLQHLSNPNQSLTDMFNQVGLEVSQATAGKQEPWISSSPLPPIYLAGETTNQIKAVATTPTVSNPVDSTETTFWQSLANSTLCGDYQAYLSNYPKGRFASLAEARSKVYCVAQPTPATKHVQAAVNPDVRVVGTDLFTKQTKWSVRESWNNDSLVYTFNPNGTFVSSSNSSKGKGSWDLDHNNLVMVWPHYEKAVYRGVIYDTKINGTAHFSDGEQFGTFEFKLIQ